MAAIRIPAGERFKVAWEVYGLAIGESAQVRIGIDDGGLSLLERAGRFFRVLEPDNPVVMSWEEAGLLHAIVGPDSELIYQAARAARDSIRPARIQQPLKGDSQP